MPIIYPLPSNQSQSDTQSQDIGGWYNWDTEKIIDQATKDPDWYKNNAGLIDYILGERSYDRRWEKNSLKSQVEQLKALGINPMLAMSLLSGAGQSISGGETSNSASYLASRENNKNSVKASRDNKTASILTSIAMLVLGALLAL